MKLDNPLLEYLGIRLLEWEPGRCVFDLEIEPRHLNRQASLQGGVTATLLDAACGYAGLQSTADAPPDNAVTVMLTISYVSKVQQGRIKAIGHVTGSRKAHLLRRGGALRRRRAPGRDRTRHVQTVIERSERMTRQGDKQCYATLSKA